MSDNKKSNDKNISLKPRGEYHTYFLVTFLILPVLLDVAFVIEGETIGIKGLLIYRLSIIAIYISVRLFLYNVKFTVNSECLTKTKGRKIIFKADVKDIVAVFIKKTSKFNIFKFWGCFLLSFIFQDPDIVVYTSARGTYISIVYKEAYDCSKGKGADRLSQISLKPETMKYCFEHSEILSFRKCMKMCKVMGIEPQFVSNKKRK